MSQKRIIGKIIGFHGIRGEIKIFPLVDDHQIFSTIDQIYIGEKVYPLESFRSHKDSVLIKLGSINDRTAAETLPRVYIEAIINEKLVAGEYYISDLIGLEVKDQENNIIGVVDNFSMTGQKLLFIKLKPEFKAKSDLLVPFVEQYILEVLTNEGYIKINLDKDLLELTQ